MTTEWRWVLGGSAVPLVVGLCASVLVEETGQRAAVCQSAAVDLGVPDGSEAWSRHPFTRDDEDSEHIVSYTKTTAILYACTGMEGEPNRVCLQFNRDDKPKPGNHLGYEYTIETGAAERLGRALLKEAAEARR